MPTRSPIIVPFMRSLALAFTRPTFEHVLTLMCGTLFASGRRNPRGSPRSSPRRERASPRPGNTLPTPRHPGTPLRSGGTTLR